MLIRPGGKRLIAISNNSKVCEVMLVIVREWSLRLITAPCDYLIKLPSLFSFYLLLPLDLKSGLKYSGDFASSGVTLSTAGTLPPQ